MIRVGRGKVRTGCKTCKRRHVKCDEARPECNRCTKAGKSCEGYEEGPAASQPVRFVVYAPQGPLTDLPDLEYPERRALDHFRDRTSQEIAGEFRSEFWLKEILPLSRRNGSIRHAIIALSSLHEQFRTQGGLQNDIGYALSHYGKAMRELVRLNQPDSEHSFDFALITCALFSAIESLQGQYHAALSHAVSGIKILAEEEARAKRGQAQKSAIPRDLLTRFFLSMDRQIMEFSDQTFTLSLRDLNVVDTDIPDKFESLDDALRALEILLDDGFHFADRFERISTYGQTPDESFQSIFVEYKALSSRHDKWGEVFEAMPAYKAEQRRRREDSGRRGNPAMLLLITYRSILKALMERMVMDDDTVYNNFVTEIWIALDAAEELLREHSPSSVLDAPPADGLDTKPRPLFSMSLGVVPILFLIAARVPDVPAREKALELLKASNRREGMWDSQVAASIAELLVTLRTQAETADPASQLKVHDISFLPGRQATMRLAIVSPNVDSGVDGGILEELIEAVEWDS